MPPMADLPQEIAAILPLDANAQLDLANKIISYAFQSKIAQLESDSQQLREAVIQKQNIIKTLERRVSNLELEVQELQAKSKQAIEDHHKLASEKSALIDTVKKLNREVAKLEAFKKNLLQHLQEDGEPGTLETSFAAVDMSAERLVADVLNSASKQHSSHSTFSVRAAGNGAVSNGPVPSTSGRTMNGYASPTRSTMYSAQSPVTSMNESPRLDGREFFKQARSRLSYEAFSQFLHNIKELNAGRQSRDQTLRTARDIFGVMHQDLYVMFEGLLSKQHTTF